MTTVQPHHAPTSMEQEIAALRAENARLTALAASTKAKPSLGLKVSTKGAVSVYGLGRWPVTLYAGQWQELEARMPAIKQFIIDNAQALQDQRPAATPTKVG
jgi:hypothetical protein